MCAKAATSDADLVFLDLEDACAPPVKESAREIAIAALTQHDWGDTRRAVRVNGLEAGPRDGVAITGESRVEIDAEDDAELVLVDAR